MRKICLIITVLILTISTMTSCSSKSEENELSTILDIDVSSGTISHTQDSHGGFHNDGLLFTEITFTDETESLKNEIKRSSLWTEMPLPESLNTLIYGNISSTQAIGPYITDEESNPLFPNVENGYYFFKDRHSESKNSGNDTDVLNRSSFNFTIAIYDEDTKTIYFAQMDT